ncbi:ABC transporter permease subunit [Bosea sp. (in: a-proteobacteria)]|uniref:ABC transporter permease n=1 Tax=Bosea sp. (in: a-proteobacteria) TaxID=1871050 RepID=UPI000B3166B3|nr:ABC transporter permease subunit [Bosea sp. (in: a-proteobacteria)]MBN9436586.1 ABC transporter permease subunit [Bosea sp. (in: a-proteobacteria)]
MTRFMSFLAWLVYAALTLPILMVIGASLTAGAYLSFPPQGLSLRWWNVMIQDPDMVNGFVVTARVAVLAVLISVPSGALAAIFLSRQPPVRRNLLAAIFTSPLSVPLVLTGFSFLVFFTQLGLLNEVGLVIGHTVIAVPYVLRSALASLSLNDTSLPRAAAIHGAKPWQVIWHVTIPMMKAGLISGGLFAFLASVNNIVVSVFVSQPGDNPLPVVIFSRMENLAEPSVAAASAAVIIATAVICLVMEKRYALFRSLAGR